MSLPTPAGLLLSSVLDVRDRYLRLLESLKALRRHLDPGVRAVLAAAHEDILTKLGTFEGSLIHLLDQAALETEPDEPDSWSEAYQQAWFEMAQQQFNSLLGTQRRLFPHLPLPPTPPADIAFFLARSVGLSATRRTHRQRFALSFSRYTIWESVPFSKDGSLAAVPVPYFETMTPLRWPLLVHELGHFVVPADDAARRARHDLVEFHVQQRLGDAANSGARSDLEEVLADRVAERACGFSYALALLREAQFASYGRHAAQSSAPSLLARLAVLDSWPVLQPVLPRSWSRWLTSGSGASVELQEARDFAVSLMPNDDSLLSRPHIVTAARDLLERGEPAGSVRILDSGDEDVLPDGADMDAHFRRGIELPCRDAEVLEAAWQLEACLPPELYLERLRDSLLDNGTLSTKRTDVRQLARAKADIAISRSLQAAAVHRWLIAHDTAIAARVGAAAPAAETRTVPSRTRRRKVERESSPLSDIHILKRLSHRDPHRRLVVRPLIDPAQIGGTTIDLRLGTEWEVLRTARFKALSPSDDPGDVTTLLDASVEQFRLTSGQDQGVVLHPGELILALTLEYLSLPGDLWGLLEGRSTWARIGLQVHASAGMVDARFDGYLTLELQNMGRIPLVLSPGLRVAQMAFFPVQGVARSYALKSDAAYSDQTSARTAFPAQHEHKALRDYLIAERAAEELDLRAFTGRDDDANHV